METKKELLDWLSKVEEPSIWYEISKLKEESEKESEFDFDKEFENGLTPEEFRDEMHKRIKAYPWKK